MFDRGRSMGLASPFPKTLRWAVSWIISALEQNKHREISRTKIGAKLYTREEKCLVSEHERVMFLAVSGGGRGIYGF